MPKNKVIKVSKENHAVITSLDELSKCAKRKYARYGKIPTKTRLTRQERRDLKLHIQSGSQEHLWRRGEEMAKLYNIRKIN